MLLFFVLTDGFRETADTRNQLQSKLHFIHFKFFKFFFVSTDGFRQTADTRNQSKSGRRVFRTIQLSV
jgi:hypothetical protein